MRRNADPLLAQIALLQERQDWDALVRSIDEALLAGYERSLYGVPLDFLRREAAVKQGERAAAQAARLAAEGDQALAEGNVNRAQRRFAQALAVPYLPPTAADPIHARVERLETQLRNYATGAYNVNSNQPEHQFDALLATLRAERPTLYRLFALCAVPRWLDIDVLCVLRQKDDGREPEVLELINGYSFVEPWESERFTLTDGVRRRFLAEWEQVPEEYRTLNARLAAHFAQRLQDDTQCTPTQVERLRQAQLYHTFLVEPPAGAALLAQFFQAAEDSRHLVAARQYVIVLQELRDQVPADYFAYVDYAEGWFHYLRGNINAAYAIFADLSTRTGFPPDLHARVLRGAGTVQVERGEWEAGLKNFERALAAFRALDKPDEVAETMAAVGSAYLDIAAEAMGEYDPLMEEYTGRQGMLSLGALLVRSPLIIYLLIKLKIGIPLPNLQRLGQGLDWGLARIFSDAIVWLTRAEQQYVELDHQAGVNATRATLGRLYWVLNAPERALEFLRPLQNSHPVGTFGRAEIDLKVAEAWLPLGHTDVACGLLVDALAVFEETDHYTRAAQCHNRLGASAEQDDAPTQAVDHYARALAAWRKSGNSVRVTQMMNRLDKLSQTHELPPEDLQAVATAAEAVPTRTYVTRYVHPLSLFYQRGAIILFALLIGLISLISVELKPEIKLISDLVLDASQLQHMNFTLSQRVIQAVELKVSPPPAQLMAFTVLLIGAFLLLYAGVGAYLVRRTSLTSIQTSSSERFELDKASITYTVGTLAVSVAWCELRQVVYSRRRLCRDFIDIFSNIGLRSSRTQLEIQGSVQGYAYLEQQIRAKVREQPEVAKTELGVSFLCGGWGTVFTVTLVLQVFFLLLAVLVPSSLEASILALPYTYADLWNLLELGVALPLLYWLIIQPARYRLYFRRARSSFVLLWIVALLGMLLALAPARFARPAVLASSASLLAGFFILYDSWRMSRRQPEEPRDRRKPARRTLGIMLIASTLIVMLLASVAMVRELVGFHHQTLGYRSFKEAEEEISEGSLELHQQQAEAQARVAQVNQRLTLLYEDPEAWVAEISTSENIGQDEAWRLLNKEIQNVSEQAALAQEELDVIQAKLDADMGAFVDAEQHFANSIAARPDARPYRFLIITLTYMGRYSEAIETLGEMENKQLVRSRLDRQLAAWILHQGAFGMEPEAQAAAWEKARGYYNLMLDNAALPFGDGMEIDRYRSALLVNLAHITTEDPLARLALLKEAETHFQAYLQHLGDGTEAEKAEAYAFLGVPQLRQGFDPDAPVELQQTKLEQGRNSFEKSMELDPSRLAPYNGLGWSLVFQSRQTPDDCINGFSEPAAAPAYIEQIERAERAFTLALALRSSNRNSVPADELNDRTLATYYRTRAQLRYILAYCDDDTGDARYTRADQLAAAASDYQRAVTVYQRAVGASQLGKWYDRLGDIRLELAELLTDQRESRLADIQYRLAATHYADALGYDLSLFETRKKLLDVYLRKLQVDEPALVTVDAIARAADASGDLAFFVRLAEEEQTRGLTTLAAAAATRALELAPDDAAVLKQAAAIYNQWALLADEPERGERAQLALSTAQRALAQSPDDARLLLAAGRGELGVGDVEAAIRRLDDALAREPDNPEILYTLGYAHLLAGDEARAGEYYAQAHAAAAQQEPVEMTPVYADAIANLIVKPGPDPAAATRQAVAIADAVLQQQGMEATDDAAAVAALATQANEGGDYDNAIPLWIKAITLAPQNNEYWQQMRTALILGPDLGQVSSGTAVLTLLLGVSDDAEVATLQEIAQLDLDDNVFGLAAAALERALERDPQNATTYAMLTETYSRWGSRWDVRHRHELAVDTMARASAAGIEQADIYYWGGLALRSLREEERALTALTRATQLDPSNRDAFSRLAWTAYLAGDYKRSAAASQAAIALDATDPREHFNLGLALTALGDAAGARAAYAAGFDAANAPANATRRTSRLNEGLTDLRTIAADPAGLATEVIDRFAAELAP